MSEVANVIELGYRAQPAASSRYSVTAFRHDWDKLRSGNRRPRSSRTDRGDMYGVEAWATWQAADRWR